MTLLIELPLRTIKIIHIIANKIRKNNTKYWSMSLGVKSTYLTICKSLKSFIGVLDNVENEEDLVELRSKLQWNSRKYKENDTKNENIT